VLREEISTIGIQNASRSDSPWYALIEVGKLRCGGSLVNDKFVVTGKCNNKNFSIKNLIFGGIHKWRPLKIEFGSIILII